jgi:hypothetical protein
VAAVSITKAIYDGRVFVPLAPVKAHKNQEAFVTIIDEPKTLNTSKSFLRFAGALSQADYDEIAEILKDTEIVHANEW